MRFGKARIVCGATAVAVVLGAASVALACVPGNAYVDHDKFVVESQTGKAPPYKLGDAMIARGGTNNTFVEKKNHPYTIKLFGGPFDASTDELKRRCGDLGIYQTTAMSNSSHRFTQPFTLNTAGILSPGTAHFCALAGLQKETSTALNATEFYIRHIELTVV